MPSIPTALVDKIKAKTQELEKGEGDLVPKVLGLSRMYVELKENVRKYQWVQTLNDIGACPRVVSRYLRIGASWLATEIVEPELLAQLPYDLVKLETMCQLSRQELKDLLGFMDCRAKSRSAVIEAVNRKLGTPVKAVKVIHVTADDIVTRWDDYVDRLLQAIDALDPEAGQDSFKKVADQLDARYAEVREALSSLAEGPKASAEATASVQPSNRPTEVSAAGAGHAQRQTGIADGRSENGNLNGPNRPPDVHVRATAVSGKPNQAATRLGHPVSAQRQVVTVRSTPT